MAAEAGLSCPAKTGGTLTAQQRQRAKAHAAARRSGARGPSEVPPCSTRTNQYRLPGSHLFSTRARGGGPVFVHHRVPAAGQGSAVEVVLDRISSHARGGGQQSDAGPVRIRDGFAVEAADASSRWYGLSSAHGTGGLR